MKTLLTIIILAIAFTLFKENMIALWILGTCVGAIFTALLFNKIQLFYYKCKYDGNYKKEI